MHKKHVGLKTGKITVKHISKNEHCNKITLSLVMGVMLLSVDAGAATLTEPKSVEGHFSIGLQRQNIENYFNQTPSSEYGEETLTTTGVKIDFIKALSQPDNIMFYYGAGISLATGSYKLEVAGPTSGTGNVDFATGLNVFVEGQFEATKDIHIIARGGYAVNLYFLGAADYGTAPTFDAYNEGVDEGSTEFFGAFGVQYSGDKNHPIKILYRTTLGDFQSAWTDTTYASRGTAVAHTYTISGFEISYGF